MFKISNDIKCTLILLQFLQFDYYHIYEIEMFNILNLTMIFLINSDKIKKQYL